MKNALEVKDLVFSYDENQNAVDGISFDIEKSTYTTIIGHNGSGKSTIAKLLIGLLEKKSGHIVVDGLELSEETIYQIRGKVGIVFQNPDNQFIGSSVRDDIAFGLENHNVDPKEMDEIIEAFAAHVNMSKYLDSEPTRLSGGQKQRVAIAGVLAMKPQILILDEATSMLDPLGKQEINQLVKSIHMDQKMTIISITHDMDEVASSDFTIVMENGKIAYADKPINILTNEKAMVDLSLDVPFATKLSKQLQKDGLQIDTHLTLEGLVDALCR